MEKFQCSICGYVYDEATGIPEKNIAAGTKWKSIPENFTCPLCGAPKSVFKPLESAPKISSAASVYSGTHIEKIKELTAGDISAIFSNLAKGCEKQQLLAEAEAFNTLAGYFEAKAMRKNKSLKDILKLLDGDMSKNLPAAKEAAKADFDRGALRSLVWNEKVSTMTKSLLERFNKEGGAMLKNTKIYVCDICGFIYIGNTPPEVCPVCKVPNYKILPVGRR